MNTFFRWKYYDIFNIWRFQFSMQKDVCNSICKFIANSAFPSSIADSMSTRKSITYDAEVLICSISHAFIYKHTCPIVTDDMILDCTLPPCNQELPTLP
jgi:hypothetical protein